MSFQSTFNSRRVYPTFFPILPTSLNTLCYSCVDEMQSVTFPPPIFLTSAPSSTLTSNQVNIQQSMCPTFSSHPSSKMNTVPMSASPQTFSAQIHPTLMGQCHQNTQPPKSRIRKVPSNLPDLPLFPCQQCERVYANKKSLASHISSIHKTHTRFRCPHPNCHKNCK